MLHPAIDFINGHHLAKCYCKSRANTCLICCGSNICRDCGGQGNELTERTCGERMKAKSFVWERKAKALDALELLLHGGVMVSQLNFVNLHTKEEKLFLKCVVPDEKHPMACTSHLGLSDLIDTAVTTIHIGCNICQHRERQKEARQMLPKIMDKITNPKKS